MLDYKPVNTPLELGMKLTLNMGDDFETGNLPYREVVWSLMYLMQGRRPDLAAAVAIVSRFCHKPGKAHWATVKRILRYVARTIEKVIVYKRGNMVKLHGYCDADWDGDWDTRKSTSGYAFLCKRVITWSSKLQPTQAYLQPSMAFCTRYSRTKYIEFVDTKGQAPDMLTKSAGGQAVLEGCKLLGIHLTCHKEWEC